ncbi:MAG TPA: flagellar hook-associated protein FlgK [Legionella sp.]|nr:flagellar hook-associated protein FlgK [Legionella sp.]
MSILSIAYSGLNAFQRALDVTGNNITNATTRGYSRQSIHFTPNPSHRYAGSFIGSGVRVDSITRNVDQFANFQVRNATSSKSQFDAFYQQAIQIDKLLSQDGTSISGSLQSFFDALGQLNNAPDNVASRGVALRQSQLLVQQFNFLQNKLDEYQNNSSTQITEAAKQINQITQDIAKVNEYLMATPNAPELLDQRDELLRQLASFVDLTVFDQGDGTISVGIASGEMLVTGTDHRNLTISSDLSNNLGTKVLLSNGSGTIDISDKLTSGMLGGLMAYERNVVGQASQMIGQMAIGLAQRFNAQHQLGLDMNNQIGKDFFTDYNSVTQQQNRAMRSPNNAGTADLSVSISDISQTKLSDYDLIVSDTASNEIRLIRKSDGTSTTLNWTNTPPAPPAGQLVIDGMTITVNDTSQLVNNDQFTLTPTRGAARDFKLQINDIREIAMAAPVRVSSSLGNSGTGQIGLGTVFNTNAVTNQYHIDVDPANASQYFLVDVTGGTSTGPFALVPNSDNIIQIPDALNPSYSVVLSGIPNAGDQFNLDFNAGGFGNNSNGLLLAGLQQSRVFSGGTENLFERYANLLAEVGGQTNQAKLRAESADVLYKQAVDFQDSKSGVNLDEEAGNLLKYKQAYEAAGKLMEISSQMMNVLFDMMR